MCECEVDYRPRWKRYVENVGIAVMSLFAAIGMTVVLGGLYLWFWI